MADWMVLGKTVPGDLLYTAIDTRGLLVGVASARRKLKMWPPLVRISQTVRTDIGDNPVAAVAWSLRPLPSADLDRAVAELARIGGLHARARRAFALYGRGVVPLQRAELHHNKARAAAADALRRLRAAAAMARAFEDAVRSARAFPRGSPDFAAWMEAAHKLATHAVVACTLVFQPVRRMRDSVCREFHCMWTVLYGPYDMICRPPGCDVM